MANIITSVVKALADFIEFDRAADLGAARGTVNETNIGKVNDQRDAFWQRYERAANAERGGKLDFRAEFAKASREVDQRRLERRRLAKARQAEIAEAREMKEMLQAM